MAKALAIVSQKGGVGKTTTAINIAAALASQGIKTLLIDADPQGAVRFGLGLHGPEHRVGLSDYVEGLADLAQVVRPTVLPWLRAVLAGSISDRERHDAYGHALASSPRLIELLDAARSRDYVVVVDTPPGLGPVSERILSASDHVMVPLQCEPLALQTSAQILRGIRAATTNNPRLVFEGILLTMLESGSPTSQRVADTVRAQLPPELVIGEAVPRTAASAEAFAAGQPLVLRTPDDPAAHVYAVLAARLARRLQ